MNVNENDIIQTFLFHDKRWRCFLLNLSSVIELRKIEVYCYEKKMIK